MARRGDRGRSDRGASSTTQRPVSTGLADPDPGPWTLDWSLVDRNGPFAWPDVSDPLYADLAAFLAHHNESSFDDVFSQLRANGKNANHVLDPQNLSQTAAERWEQLYEKLGLDDLHNSPDPMVLTYCLGHGDGRRVVVAYNAPDRRLLPLWWDANHEVSGSDGAQRDPGPCDVDCKHPAAR
jgi:hypothetical protein